MFHAGEAPPEKFPSKCRAGICLAGGRRQKALASAHGSEVYPDV